MPAALSLKGTGIVFVATRGADIVGPSRKGAGVYAWDTRYLSTYEVRPRTGRLRLVEAEILPDGALLIYMWRGQRIERRVHIDTEILDKWVIHNDGRRPATFEAELIADADFRDLFEVRRRSRTTVGRLEQPVLNGHVLELAYVARDRVRSVTEIRAPVDRWRLDHASPHGWIRTDVPAGTTQGFLTDIRVRSTLPPLPFAPRDWSDWQSSVTRFESDSPELNAWIERSMLDLFLLADRTPDGYIASAGIPWFVALFGRDAITTSLFALTLRRDLVVATLRQLADRQGKVDNAQRDEDPGRIPHEVRYGEIVRTGGAFGTPYYGSVDATPLFVLLAAEAARWVPERDVIAEFEANIRAALTWIDKVGDRDGDGFVEYQRKAPTGIENQVWKDSGDSVLLPNGKKPETPIAAVEVQAYVIAAKRALAEVVAQRDPEWAVQLAREAQALAVRFERTFWMPKRGFYGQALDAHKRLIPDIVSNPGHVLWVGAASAAHGRLAAKRLRQTDLASGWGIRTRSARSKHYDPVSYQNGSVWPHDTAMAAAGMARYGDKAGAARIIADMIAAATAFPDRRIPELFGGQPRRKGVAPTQYPVACVPQSWSAAATFLCIRTMLGLEVGPDGTDATLDPLLPDGVNRLTAEAMRVGTGSIDVTIVRRGQRVVADIQASGISTRIR